MRRDPGLRRHTPAYLTDPTAAHCAGWRFRIRRHTTARQHRRRGLLQRRYRFGRNRLIPGPQHIRRGIPPHLGRHLGGRDGASRQGRFRRCRWSGYVIENRKAAEQRSDQPPGDTGAERAAGRRAAPEGPGDASGPAAVDRAWAAFQAGEGRAAGTAILTLPSPDAKAIRIRWLPKGVESLSARNEARYDAATGALLASEHAADTPLGKRLMDNILEVHRGRFFGDVFALLFCLAALAMPGFAATGLTLYVLRRRAAARRRPKAVRSTLREANPRRA